MHCTHTPVAVPEICARIAERAGNLFHGRRLWCSAAVLSALNGALGGDLSETQVIRLTAGLSNGLGGSGCLCGALAGGVLALGLLLGTEQPRRSGDTRVMRMTRQLHRRFEETFGATCCRILIRKREPGMTSSFQSCGFRTAQAARWTAELILEAEPARTRSIDPA